MSLREKILFQDYVLLDGGLATTLELNGYTLDRELWSAWSAVINPESVIEVHKQFMRAGSEIITTASYQMSYEGFKKKGYHNDQEIEMIFQSSTDCAIKARESLGKRKEDVLIATSIGCYGAHLADGSEYRGNYGLSVEQLQRWHQLKFEVLARSGVELVACETIPSLPECRALINLVSHELPRLHQTSLQTPLEGWLTCACNSGTTLNSGENLEDVVRLLKDSNDNSPHLSSWGIGINCTNPCYINELLDVLRDAGAMSGSPGRPIVVYPNRGELWDAEGRRWNELSGCSDESFSVLAREWKANGANVLGGCCRTTPETITRMREVLK
jgi:homocysteine S-methyltransferase